METQLQAEKPKSVGYWEARIKSLTGSLASAKGLVANTESKIQTATNALQKQQNIYDNLAPDASDTIKEEYQLKIAAAEASLEELAAELAERQARVADLEAQIAEAYAEIEKLTNQ